jgi:hypothetical protein
MIAVLIAMVGYPVGTVVVGGFILVTVIGVVLTSSRSRTKGVDDRDRTAGLGCLSMVFGPLVGLALASLACEFGDVHPMDVGYTFAVFTAIGTLAGLIGGAAFATAASFSGRESSPKGEDREFDL